MADSQNESVTLSLEQYHKLVYALRATERMLEGGYLWLLNKPTFTQREARECCLSIVKRALEGHPSQREVHPSQREVRPC